MPGEEDFGITAVEALASGKPVIALGRGGVLESVPQEPWGGLFYDEPGEQGLLQAIERFEGCESRVRPEELQGWARRFSEAEFARKMQAIVGGRMEDARTP